MAQRCASQVNHGFGVAGFEGAHVGADEVAGAVAVEGGFVLAADDGKGAQDVAGILPRDAIEVEIEGVQAGAQVAAFFFIPDEGRAAVAEVAGERRHVVGGIGEAEHVIAHEVASGLFPELAVVVLRRDHGQLLDDVPTEIRASHLLTGNEVVDKTVDIGNEKACICGCQSTFRVQ